MAAITVTLDTDCTHTLDQITMMTGTLTLSASYVNGTGDSWTAAQFGLGVVKDLWIQPTVWNIVATITTGGASGVVKVYGTGSADQGKFDEAANGDLSTYSARFMAWGW